jgi:hypothetical protein
MRQRPASPPYDRHQSKGTTMGHITHSRQVWVLWNVGAQKFSRETDGLTRYVDEAARYDLESATGMCEASRGVYLPVRIEWSHTAPDTTTPGVPSTANAAGPPDFILCVSPACGMNGAHMVCTVPDCEFVIDRGQYDQIYLHEFRAAAEGHMQRAHPQSAGGTE